MAPRTRKSAVASQPAAAPSGQKSIFQYSKPTKQGVPTPTKSTKRKVEEILDQDEESQLPSKKVRVFTALPTPEQTPKKAQKTLPRKQLPGTPAKASKPIIESVGLPTPESTPSRHEKSSEPVLPEQLQDLVDLHHGFLKALSLHYAHSDASSPINVRLLIPSIAQCWRKRTPTLLDLRRIMAIASHRSMQYQLELIDYGHSNLCIERTISSTHKSDLFPPTEMHSDFIANLNAIWSANADKVDAESFITALSLFPTTVSTSLKQMKAVHTNGQQRLSSFRSRLLEVAKESNANANDPTNPPNTTTNTTRPPLNRTSSLLHRIKQKQITASLKAAQSVANPNAASRRMALNRLEEVINTLDMLSAKKSGAQTSILGLAADAKKRGKGHQSFSLAQLTQTIQRSLRNPISSDEVRECVKMLGEEVAPGWVEMCSLGKIEGVVLKAEGRAEVQGWRERVKVSHDQNDTRVATR